MLKNHTYESQNTWHRFFAYPLFQILKKHTYKSQNTLFILIIILKETIHIKTIIQKILIKNNDTNRQAQSQIYNHCMYTHNYYDKVLLFFFTVYKNERKEHKF